MKVVGIAGHKDTGKTSLVESLVSELRERGRVATVKSIHHDVEVDEEGKDTYRHKKAGAERVVGITPSTRFEVAEEDKDESSLKNALDDLADDGYDYAVIEGFKSASVPTVVMGGSDIDVEGEVIAEYTSPDDADTENLVSSIEALESYETLGSLVRRAKQHPDSPKAGAIATFTGRVRVENHEDVHTTYLEFEKYEDVADQRLDKIRDDLKNRDGVYEVLMYHKTGVVEGEDDIVHVVVLAGHRDEAFETVEDGINRLKDEVPIFKKEVTEGGDYWVHNRP